MKVNAVEFIERFMPSNVVAQIDLSDLTLDNTVYAAAKLTAFYADVVYRARLKSDASVLLAFLFEQKHLRPSNNTTEEKHKVQFS